jgi:hypothetical protein
LCFVEAKIEIDVPPPRRRSTVDGYITTTATMENNNQQNQRYMIALYYCYPPPNGLPPLLVESHATFHRETCSQLDLNGRIRVCIEGINGVLSGLEDNLRLYELLVRCELSRLCPPGNEEEDRCVKQDDSDEEGEADDPTADWFDVKYCQLRNDIPIDKQLFDSLSVKITKEVVSLIDKPTITQQQQRQKQNRNLIVRRKIRTHVNDGV